MSDASPLLPPPAGKPAPRFARCTSHAHDELRSFRACLAWLCVDHSPSQGLAAAGSWAVFLLLAVAAPAAARLLPSALSSPRPYDGQVQVSLTLAASLAYVSLRAVLRRSGGLRRLLYLDSLRRDSEDVQAGYAAELARSFRVLACFVLPCALAEAAYKACWYYYAYAASPAPAPGSSPWWAAAAAATAALEVASWVYRVALFFMVCVLFRVICYLQILRMVGFAREFGRFADVATVLQHHRRIREQLRKISHRYRKFIVCSLVLVSASQFAALLNHQAQGRRQSRHRRRPRAVLGEPGGWPAGVPAQRGEDHAQDAGDDERGGGVARGRHGARLRQRPGGPGPGPAPDRGLPGARQRLPRGHRRRVRQRRRRRRRDLLLPRRPQARPVPGQQHLLPEAAGARDVPGEQQRRDHGVRVRGGPGVAARALHDRVLARHVAARQDGRHLLKRSTTLTTTLPDQRVQIERR